MYNNNGNKLVENSFIFNKTQKLWKKQIYIL